MFCEGCGKQLKEGARFCIACGKPVQEAENEPSKEIAGGVEAELISGPVKSQSAPYEETCSGPDNMSKETPRGMADGLSMAKLNNPLKVSDADYKGRIQHGEGIVYLTVWKIIMTAVFAIMVLAGIVMSFYMSEEVDGSAAFMSLIICLLVSFIWYAFNMLMLNAMENIRRTTSNTAIMAEILSRQVNQ